jgi:hypothetical protein
VAVLSVISAVSVVSMVPPMVVVDRHVTNRRDHRASVPARSSGPRRTPRMAADA